ncbi:CFAD factor, partial [Atractosteus spatula]|nr:CFAD factor [Atractosteus spatula]
PAALLCINDVISSADSLRIIRGNDAAPHSRPYMASIQKNGQHYCGGFLVARQWVMSAAHCFTEQEERRSKIVLGAHSLGVSEDTKQVFEIQACYSHPEFLPDQGFDNDIALLKLDREAILTAAVQPVAFQRGGQQVPEGTQCSAAGWGWTSNSGNLPGVLQEVSVEVLGRRLCARSDYYGEKFTENMMCASKCDKNNKKLCKDTCKGDSGGPLVCDGKAAGITSHAGVKCGWKKKPGVYTVISRYTAWLQSIMGQRD